MLTKTRVLTGFLACVVMLNAQTYPPAQGPPPVTEQNVGEFPVYLFISDVLAIEIQKKLNEINDTLHQRTDVRAKVSLASVKAYNPYMAQTRNPDRPNHRVVRVMHMVKLNVYDIRFMLAREWTNYPWGRSLSFAVDVDVLCSGWETGSGTLAVRGESQPPYLDPDPPLSEEIVNNFLGDWFVDYVNAKIRQSLGGGGVFSRELLGKCTSLGTSTGSPDTHEDDVVRWNRPSDKIGGAPPGAEYQQPLSTVRVVRVKRLQAHKLDGGVLYDQVESPILDFWAGFGFWQYQLPPLSEGQEVLLSQPAIAVYPRLEGPISLVTIASVIQRNTGVKDTSFRVFSSATSYGAGTQTIVVGKTYWQRPQPPLKKPIKITVPAYEITFEVSAPPRTPPRNL